ncbi:unnamed protein product [Rotaria sordida]|uniref:Uncharacterized protein n=1 Tax=Rotaria sordida TaxID=392033 RepID=A0A813VA17_9BILA|nr:unnamed protein product [Rotaria sordida]
MNKDHINYILLSILAVLFPPAATFIIVGCTTHFWINLVLTLLGWIPGVIHALWLIWVDHVTLFLIVKIPSGPVRCSSCASTKCDQPSSPCKICITFIELISNTFA